MAKQNDQVEQTTEPLREMAAPADIRPSTEIVAQADDSASSSPHPVAAPLGAHFVYAIGRIEPRFPTLAVEKEFAQVRGRGDTAGLTDRKALQTLLSQRANRYLVRQLCWVFVIEGIETYLLQPRDPVDADLLLESLRPSPRATDIDVVVGVMGPIAPPELCNGIMVPIVIFDQLYAFDVDSLVASIPRPKGMKAEDFAPAAEELLTRVMRIRDNAGATEADRALNYLSVRYPAIYHKTAERFASDAALTGVEVRRSSLSGVRSIVDVIFSYTDRKTDVVDKHFVRVDVTEEFPFLVNKLSPYFDIGG